MTSDLIPRVILQPIPNEVAAHSGAQEPHPATADTVRVRKRKATSFSTIRPAELVIRYILLIIVLLIAIAPFLWELSTSLKGPGESVTTAVPRFIPEHPTFESYIRVISLVPVIQYVINSLAVAAMGIFGNVIFASLAGFALARMQFRGKKYVVGFILAALILPAEATIVSQFVLITKMGLADTLVGVALPGFVSILNVLLMYNAFRMIPEEIDQAAVIDGATSLQRLWHVGLPSVKGTVAVIIIFAFIGAWDDFLWPLIVLTTSSKFTLTVGLQYLAGTFSSDPRAVAAGVMIAFIPLVIFFATLQRHFFKGVEEGGVKG